MLRITIYVEGNNYHVLSITICEYMIYAEGIMYWVKCIEYAVLLSAFHILFSTSRF